MVMTICDSGIFSVEIFNRASALGAALLNNSDGRLRDRFGGVPGRSVVLPEV
jgi:hypothetical protein